MKIERYTLGSLSLPMIAILIGFASFSARADATPGYHPEVASDLVVHTVFVDSPTGQELGVLIWQESGRSVIAAPSSVLHHRDLPKVRSRAIEAKGVFPARILGTLEYTALLLVDSDQLDARPVALKPLPSVDAKVFLLRKATTQFIATAAIVRGANAGLINVSEAGPTGELPAATFSKTASGYTFLGHAGFDPEVTPEGLFNVFSIAGLSGARMKILQFNSKTPGLFNSQVSVKAGEQVKAWVTGSPWSCPQLDRTLLLC